MSTVVSRVPPNMTDYEEARRTFRLPVPERFNYAIDVVDARAAHDPAKLALVAVDESGSRALRYTFRDLARASNRVANFLAAQGIGKGDRVFVMLPRIPEWHLVLLGCIKLGAVPMPGTPLLTARDLEYRIGRAEAAAAIVDPEGSAKVDEVRDRLESLRVRICVGEPAGAGWLSLADGVERASDGPPDAEPTASDDPMLIYFTSGTTGYPKMVLHTQASYGIGHELTARFWQDLHETDLHWTFSDTGWAKAAWGKMFGQWRMGAAVFLWDLRGKPDFERMLRLLGEHGVTTFCAPPTVFRAMVVLDLQAFDWSSLRHVVSAGEPLNPEVIRIWREATGLPIYDGYGQTETVNIVANYRCLPVREGSMGKPVPGVDVRVVDDDGNVLGAGETGHIAVRRYPERPVGLFREYWRDPEATAASFRGDWYDTGDLASVDEDGYLWFVGRADDVITSSAYRIGPFEVESAIVEHRAVAEAAVVGKPDPLRGEIVKAFVALKPGFEPSDDLARDIQEHVKRVTAPYKYPREIEFVPELPKTVSGKIRRVELRERERRGPGGS
ncbi:MAG TPA: AMP-binding protein [Actinomycetota bacterium]|nr:AMP-binding protein [Actinomycetota bacterium]